MIKSGFNGLFCMWEHDEIVLEYKCIHLRTQTALPYETMGEKAANFSMRKLKTN
jgi:hypothetical protein